MYGCIGVRSYDLVSSMIVVVSFEARTCWRIENIFTVKFHQFDSQWLEWEYISGLMLIVIQKWSVNKKTRKNKTKIAYNNKKPFVRWRQANWSTPPMSLFKITFYPLPIAHHVINICIAPQCHTIVCPIKGYIDRFNICQLHKIHEERKKNVFYQWKHWHSCE